MIESNSICWLFLMQNIFMMILIGERTLDETETCQNQSQYNYHFVRFLVSALGQYFIRFGTILRFKVNQTTFIHIFFRLNFA